MLGWLPRAKENIHSKGSLLINSNETYEKKKKKKRNAKTQK